MNTGLWHSFWLHCAGRNLIDAATVVALHHYDVQKG